MFNHLGDLGYNRNAKEAFGFYLAYLLIIILAAFLVGVLFTLIANSVDSSRGESYGAAIAIVITFILSFMVLRAKNLLDNFGYILLAFLSAILAFFGGGLLGLIPVAFLTTRERKIMDSRAAGN